MAHVNKITKGFVFQTFDTEIGEFVFQVFVPDKSVIYEVEGGAPVNIPLEVVNGCLPFEMKQPKGDRSPHILYTDRGEHTVFYALLPPEFYKRSDPDEHLAQGWATALLCVSCREEKAILQVVESPYDYEVGHTYCCLKCLTTHLTAY